MDISVSGFQVTPLGVLAEPSINMKIPPGGHQNLYLPHDFFFFVEKLFISYLYYLNSFFVVLNLLYF